MSDSMTLERFRALADAYGGSVARWPERERDAAQRWAGDPAGRAVLLAAAALDEALDGWTEPRLDPVLAARIAGSAPKRPARAWRLFWPALGLAAALAGVVAGAVVTTAMTPRATSAESGTVFDVNAGEEG